MHDWVNTAGIGILAALAAFIVWWVWRYEIPEDFRMFDWLRSALSPTRRLRETFARQLAALNLRLGSLNLRLGSLVEDLAKSRSELAAAVAAEALARAQADYLTDQWRSAESKLALADAENARLHVELDAAIARHTEIAGRVDAAEAVRDRAITDMNHVADELKAAKAEREASREQVGKLMLAATDSLAEVQGLETLVKEWVGGVVGRATRSLAAATTAGATTGAARPESAKATPRDEVRVRVKGPLPAA